MRIMEQIAGFMEVFKELLGIPIVVSHTISEGVSEGITDGINRNKKWVERGAVKLSLFFVGLFFFFWGVSSIGDNAFPQYKGYTAIALGIISGFIIFAMSNKE